jgi:antitoxin PrlF
MLRRSHLKHYCRCACRYPVAAVGKGTRVVLGNTSHSVGITEAQVAVTVTRKGQVTIPKPIRDRLGIKPGSKLDFEIAEDGRAFLRKLGKGRIPPSRFERMRGTATSGLTTEEIMALTRGEA